MAENKSPFPSHEQIAADTEALLAREAGQAEGGTKAEPLAAAEAKPEAKEGVQEEGIKQDGSIPRSRLNQEINKRKRLEEQLKGWESKKARIDELENMDQILTRVSKNDPEFADRIQKAVSGNAEQHASSIEAAVEMLQSGQQIPASMLKVLRGLEQQQQKLMQRLEQTEQTRQQETAVNRHLQEATQQADAFFGDSSNSYFKGNKEFFNAAIALAKDTGAPLGQALEYQKKLVLGYAQSALEKQKSEFASQNNGTRAKAAAALSGGPAGTVKEAEPPFGSEAHVEWVVKQMTGG